MIPHAGTILTPPASNQHHAVLLHIVPFPGDIRRDDPAGAEAHLGRLALAGVGLLGLRDPDFEADAFHLGTPDHGGGEGAALFLRPAAPVPDLVEGCVEGRGGGEGAVGGLDVRAELQGVGGDWCARLGEDDGTKSA